VTGRRDVVDLLALGALWGAAFLLMRIAAPAFGPVALIAVRVTVAAFVLTGVLAARGGLGGLTAHWKPLVVVGALNTAVPFTLFAYAALSLPAGITSTLNATVPLFGALVGWGWFGARPTIRRMLGLGVGFVGVVLLAWPRMAGAGAWRAVAAALTAAALYAVAAHVTPRWLTGMSALGISTGSQIASSALLVPLALRQWPVTAPGLGAWTSAIVLGVACTALAYVMYFRLLARAGPTVAMTVTYLIPLFGVSWGALLLGERLPGTSLVGGLLVLVGVAQTATMPMTRAR
jgi:drug/metabolite transporter (DMT)-like permease